MVLREEVVRDTIPIILENKIDGQSLEYYVMAVDLVCTYSLPFPNNKPVGKLNSRSFG